jgi:hypothetical protein
MRGGQDRSNFSARATRCHPNAGPGRRKFSTLMGAIRILDRYLLHGRQASQQAKEEPIVRCCKNIR